MTRECKADFSKLEEYISNYSRPLAKVINQARN